MIARMNGEDYAIDSATLKASVCSASEFVAGSASRFCTRPSNHHGPHAFPVDPQTVLAQREVAKLREQLADLARVNAAELQRVDLQIVALRAELGDARRGESAARAAVELALPPLVTLELSGTLPREERIAVTAVIDVCRKVMAGEL